MSRWQSSNNVESRDCSRGLLAPKYGAASQPEPLRLQASRGAIQATDASASVPQPRRLHPVPFAAIPSKKGKGTLEKNCLIGSFAFLWTLSLLSASCVRQMPTVRLVAASLPHGAPSQPADLFALVTSALPVVFVCLSTTLNERSFLTEVAKNHSHPKA